MNDNVPKGYSGDQKIWTAENEPFFIENWQNLCIKLRKLTEILKDPKHPRKMHTAQMHIRKLESALHWKG
jgi:hypothetical protein